jgi:hypothetical protein
MKNINYLYHEWESKKVAERYIENKGFKMMDDHTIINPIDNKEIGFWGILIDYKIFTKIEVDI